MHEAHGSVKAVDDRGLAKKALLLLLLGTLPRNRPFNISKIYFQFFKKHSDVFQFSDFAGWVSLNSTSEDSGNSQSISVPKQEEPSSLGNDSDGRSNESLMERYAVDSHLLQICVKFKASSWLNIISL